MSFIDEIQSLDTSNPGGWSNSVKLFFVILLAILIIAGGYYFFIKDMRANLEKLQRTETELKKDFAIKHQKAAQLDAYKEQLEEMEIILQSMLRQLPSKNEMSDLIVDV